MGHCLSTNTSGHLSVVSGNTNIDCMKTRNSVSKVENNCDVNTTESETHDSNAYWSIQRSLREPWGEYLRKTYWENLFKSNVPEANKQTDIQEHLGALKGDLSNISQTEPKMFSIFVSSTFTDTEAERNLLIEDVQPYLREVCSLFGYEFRFCEMRWGVRDEASEDHQTTNLCIQELYRCQQESRGINFITLLCDKYGYCPFPSEIPSDEFHDLLSNITEKPSKDIIKKWFKIDTNKQQPVLILQRISDVLHEYNIQDEMKRKTAKNLWWQEFELMQQALKKASIALKSEDRRQLYQISVTEYEVYNGLLKVCSPNEKTFMIDRVFTDIEEHVSETGVGKFIDIDWDTMSINKESRQQLKELKSKKIPTKLDENNIITYELNWSHGGISKDDNFEYLKDVTDTICRRVFDSIKTHMINEKNRNIEMGLGEADSIKKSLLHEVSTGAATLKKWSTNVIGRESLLDRIQHYCFANNCSEVGKFSFVFNEPLLIFGESGSGKSSVMSAAIRNALQRRQEGCVVIFRFIGTTSQSGHTKSLLMSIIRQIRAVKNDDFKSDAIPDNINVLANQFNREISEFESDAPGVQLILFLDALDQLTDLDIISEIQWLPKSLPRNVRIIVSCTPSNAHGAVYFNYLHGFIRNENFVEIEKMTEEGCSLLLHSWLDNDKRQLETDQKELVETLFRSCPLPLFMKIAYGETRSWRSYTDISNHPMKTARNIEDLLAQFFNRLSTVHGKMLFERGMAYITAARHGLSRQEIEDVMSCDEEILNDVFQWWIPPIRRIPSLQVVRFLSDLDEYLTETSGFSDRIPLLNWFHRQCRELVIKMMESSQDTKEIHKTLARYFSGHWAEHGKPYRNKENKEVTADRKLPRNQLVVQGNLIKSLDAARKNQSFVELSKDDCKINTRRLNELCFHLIKANLWQDVEENLCSLEYIQAKAMNGQMDDLRQEYALALVSESTFEWPTKSNVADFSSFVLQRGHVINKYPTLVYQEAANYKNGTAVRNAYETLKQKPAFILSTSHSNDEALYGVIEGHNDAVLCVAFQRSRNSPETSHWVPFKTSTTSVSASQNYASGISVKYKQSPGLFDENGALENQVLHMPEPKSKVERSLKAGSQTIKEETSEPSKNLLASGSLDGRIKIWSYTSALEMASFQAHTKAVNDCDFLDGLLLSISADAKMCLWNATDFTQLQVWEVPQEQSSIIAGNSCRIIDIEGNILECSCWDDGIFRIGDRTGNWLFQTELYEYPATSFSFMPRNELIIGFADGKISNCNINVNLQPKAEHIEYADCLTEKCNLKEVFNILQYEDIIVVTGKEKQIRTQFSEDSNSGWAKNMFRNDKLVQQWVEEGMEYTHAIQKKMDIEMASKGAIVLRKGQDDSYFVHVLDGLPTPHEYVCIDLCFPYLATGGSDGSVRLWLIERSESDNKVSVSLVLEIGRHTAEVNKLCFSADGLHLASCSDGNDIRIWDIQKAIDGDGKRAMKTKYIITGCATSERNDYAVTWGKRGMASMWKINESKCLWNKICCSSEDINSAAITPDGGKVMMVGDNYYELLNGETGCTYDVKRSCVGRKVCISCFSADGRTALLGDNCDIRLVVIEPEMKPLGFDDVVWQAHDSRVTCAQFGTGRYFVISGSEDGKVKFWNTSQVCIYEIDIGQPLIYFVYVDVKCTFACVVQGEIEQDVRFTACQQQESLKEDQDREAEKTFVSEDSEVKKVSNIDENPCLSEPLKQHHEERDESFTPSCVFAENTPFQKVKTGNATWFLPEVPVAKDDMREDHLAVQQAFPFDDVPPNFFLNADQLQGPSPMHDAPQAVPAMSEEMLQNLQNLQALLMSPPDPSSFAPPDIPLQKPGPHRLQKKEKRNLLYEPKRTVGTTSLGVFYIDLESGIGRIVSKKIRNGLRNCIMSSDANTVYCSSTTGDVYVWRMIQNEWFDIARTVNDNESFVANLGSDCIKILVSAGEHVNVITVVENEIWK